MTRKVQWNSDALPYDQTLDQVLYEIRRSDAGESLLLDAVSAQDIIEDADGSLAFDALVTPYAKLERKMEVLQGVMVRSGESVKPVAMQVTEPFKQRGVANVAAIFELSDGQTVSIFFHNPDVTPNKMAAGDEVISWKWLLNKKDITIVVAPERGEDLNIREVARRIIRLAEKNSPAFQRANGKRAERMQGIQTLKDEISSLESELAAAQHELEVAKVSAEDAQNRKNREYAEAVQRVNETGDAYIRAGENGGIDPKTGKTKEELRALSDSQAADAQRLKDIANGVPVKEPEFDPTSPEGYAQVTADESLQLKWQDRLDAFFQERAVEVRNALRGLGWEGDLDDKNKGLSRRFDKRIQGANGDESTLYIARAEYKQVGAGSNVVGMSWGVVFTRGYGDTNQNGDVATIQDDLTNGPDQLAAEIDALATRDSGIEEAAKVGAGGTAKKPDISYRQSSDGLFTSFYPNTPEGEKAWNIINATPGAEGGKVLAAHAESTITQLRDAGYSVVEDASAQASAEEDAALLAELGKTAIPAVNVQNEAKTSDIQAMFYQSEKDLIEGFSQSKQKGYSVRSTWAEKFREAIIGMGEQPVERDNGDEKTVYFDADVAGKFYVFARGYKDIGKHAVAYVKDQKNNELAKFESEGNTAYAPLALAVEWAIAEAKKPAENDSAAPTFVEPSKPFDAYLDEAGGDTFEAAKSFYREELQGRVVNTVIGGVHMTGSGFKEMKRGMKSDALKAKLTASVPEILSAGRYDGKSKPHKERGDGFVAFHFFEKEVEVDAAIVTAGVNVGEREDKRFEYIAYGLNHSENAAWKKREASGGAGNEPASDASPGSVAASLDSILGEGDEGINIVILKVVDKATGKRLTDLEDVVGQGSEAPEEAAGETALSRIESILAATDGAAKVRYEAGGKVYISVAGDGKQGEMRYVLFYYKGSAGEFLKSYRHGNGLLSDAFLANVQRVEKAFAEAGIAVVDKEGNTTMAPSQPEAKAATQEEQSEATEGPAKDRMAALKMLTDTGMNVWMSEGQNKAVIAGLMGEEWKFFADKMKELSSVIGGMPKTYDQDGMGDAAVAHLHYFRGAADWYITEKDMEGKGTEQAFGLADLGYGGELGYISIDELISAGVELDFHFAPKTVGQIMGKSEAGAPESQEKAPEASPEDQQKQADQALFQSVIDGSIPDILAPELADSLESAYYRQQTDPALVSLFEQAVSAYQNAMMSATAELA